MRYLSELRTHWRPLLAALIGFGSGLSFTTTTASTMGPHLLAEFGWSRAEYAVVSATVVALVISIPIVGRLTDLIGVRRTALIGVVCLPITFTALSMMQGDIETYIGLTLFKTVACGTTTATVYSRIVVQYVERARGLALAIVASGPAIATAVLGPMLNTYVEAEGWRAGYVALAIFTGGMGVIALLIMPPERKSAATAPRADARRTREDYLTIAKTGSFWILIVAMLLCNLPQVVALSQLNLIMLQNGVPTANAGVMISAFAMGTLFGRFLCGLALDRFPASIVSAIGMGLPSVGLLLLASSFDAPAALTLAVFAIGLSYGAEGDLLGYLVVRQFGVRIYSTVLGLLTAAIALSIASGSALLGLTLARFGDDYTPFLLICAGAVMLGALLLLLLRKPASASVEASAPMPVSPAAETQG
jgi:MFS family permease